MTSCRGGDFTTLTRLQRRFRIDKHVQDDACFLRLEKVDCHQSNNLKKKKQQETSLIIILIIIIIVNARGSVFFFLFGRAWVFFFYWIEIRMRF